MGKKGGGSGNPSNGESSKANFALWGAVAVAVAACAAFFLPGGGPESKLIAKVRQRKPVHALESLEAFQECLPLDECVALAEILAQHLPLPLLHVKDPKAAIDAENAEILDDVLGQLLSKPKIRADAFHDYAVQSASRLPAFNKAWSLAHAANTDGIALTDDLTTLAKALAELDKTAVVQLWSRIRTSPQSEGWETFFRVARTVLLRYAADLDARATAVAAAVGCQAFLTDFMWETSPEEEEMVKKLPLGDSSPAMELRAMYGPLMHDEHFKSMSRSDALQGAIKNGRRLESSGSVGVLGISLWRTQVVEPLLEKYWAKQIEVWAEPKDNTSTVVRAMYEVDPYPKWESLTTPDWPPALQDFLLKAASASPVDPRTVLVAGCGTGHWTVGFAKHFPMHDVTAVDLSIASLSYAKRKAMDIDLENLKLAHADLLELPPNRLPPGSIDFLESSGVLHHLADPSRGFAVVSNLLRPGGVALLALYSKIARRKLDNVHAWIQRGAPKPPYDPAERSSLRRFRADVLRIKKDSPWADVREWLVKTSDFWSLSRVRDLVFHPMEHQYRARDLEKQMSKHGLKFLKFAPWAISSDKRQKWIAMYGTEPAEDRNFSRWDAFENKFPDTFQGMFVFFVQKEGGDPSTIVSRPLDTTPV